MSERLATDRDPRPILDDPVQLGVFLEGPEPPLGLAQNEVEAIVGHPIGPNPNRPWEFDVVPGFEGVRFYKRNDTLVYCRDDGRELTYRYEGDMAYALVLEDDDDAG